jgi:predicted dienelactone hydrolase
MPYDPLARGPLPVGVRSATLTDPARDGRTIDVELWYPATGAFAGRDTGEATRDRYELLPGVSMWQLAARDADAAVGSFPVVAFSHGFGSHRRQSTFLCTHLASRGYVVVAPDHTGNTVRELIATAMGGRRSPVAIATLLDDRPADVSLAIDHALAACAGADASRIGVTGHSFGGWTALAAISRDDRIRAAVPLAPAGGASSATDPRLLFERLDFDWNREVPTLFIVAELDSVLPLASMPALYDPVRSQKRMVVIERADHMHFCDAVERIHEMFRMLPRVEGVPSSANSLPIAALAPGEHGYVTVRGLTLAHFDAYLNGDDAAREFLVDDWRDMLRAHGVAFTER